MFLSASDISKRIPVLNFPVSVYRADGSVDNVHRAELSRLAAAGAVVGFGTRTRVKKLFIHPEDHGAHLRRARVAQSRVRMIRFVGKDPATGHSRRFEYFELKGR